MDALQDLLTNLPVKRATDHQACPTQHTHGLQAVGQTMTPALRPANRVQHLRSDNPPYF